MAGVPSAPTPVGQTDMAKECFLGDAVVSDSSRPNGSEQTWPHRARKSRDGASRGDGDRSVWAGSWLSGTGGPWALGTRGDQLWSAGSVRPRRFSGPMAAFSPTLDKDGVVAVSAETSSASVADVSLIAMADAVLSSGSAGGRVDGARSDERAAVARPALCASDLPADLAAAIAAAGWWPCGSWSSVGPAFRSSGR